MKRNILVMTVAGLAMLAWATSTLADKEAGKEISIAGDAKCAKCMLKETDKCQTVIQAEKDGKKVTYYLVQNEVSNKFHEDVCTDAKKVAATGTDKEVDGKHQFTVTKIALAK